MHSDQRCHQQKAQAAKLRAEDHRKLYLKQRPLPARKYKQLLKRSVYSSPWKRESFLWQITSPPKDAVAWRKLKKRKLVNVSLVMLQKSHSGHPWWFAWIYKLTAHKLCLACQRSDESMPMVRNYLQGIRGLLVDISSRMRRFTMGSAHTLCLESREMLPSVPVNNPLSGKTRGSLDLNFSRGTMHWFWLQKQYDTSFWGLKSQLN